jgi:hypothetical protein
MATIIGTAFFVHGQWYFRHEGGGGSMLPIEAKQGELESLQDGGTFTISGGFVSDHRGCPQRVHATEIRALKA